MHGIGQTDGQKCRNTIALCMHCMLTHDKNDVGYLGYSIGDEAMTV